MNKVLKVILCVNADYLFFHSIYGMSEILAMLVILRAFHLFYLSEVAVETNFLSGMPKKITILLFPQKAVTL